MSANVSILDITKPMGPMIPSEAVLAAGVVVPDRGAVDVADPCPRPPPRHNTPKTSGSAPLARAWVCRWDLAVPACRPARSERGRRRLHRNRPEAGLPTRTTEQPRSCTAIMVCVRP